MNGSDLKANADRQGSKERVAMTKPNPAWTFISTIFPSLLVAYAFHPVAWMGAMILEPYGYTLGHAVLAAVWLVQAMALIVAFVLLLKVKGGVRRMARGLFAAGAVLLASVLLFVIAALQEAHFTAASDPQPMLATALTGVIFSGHYGVLGLIFLILAAILHRYARPDQQIR